MKLVFVFSNRLQTREFLLGVVLLSPGEFREVKNVSYLMGIVPEG